MSDDFDEPDFDSESNDVPAKTPIKKQLNLNELNAAYDQKRVKFLSQCQFSTQKQFTQNTFDYQRKLSQLIIREQMTTASSMRVETGTQTYVNTTTESQSVQAPESRSISALDLLLIANKTKQSKKAFPMQILTDYIKSNTQQLSGQSSELIFTVQQQLQLTESDYAAIVQFRPTLKPSFANEVNHIGTAQIPVPMCKSSNVIIIIHSNQTTVINLPALQLCTLNNDLYACLESGIVVQISDSSILSQTNPLNIVQISGANQKIIGISSTNVYQFNSDLNDVETVVCSSTPRFIQSTRNQFVAVFDDFVQFFDSISELKTKKEHFVLKEKITEMEIINNRIKVVFENGAVEEWEGEGVVSAGVE
ncbi:Conserved_hypothetical protein [Hexamita inflata]|uniref:Uncharacterized protein n=1 Tax=Hexamita inflata TaxID=28002 RepID=A0AA86PVD9_9EUKA|nr:Conserved hypothetical protein [Hexamita inflata]